MAATFYRVLIKDSNRDITDLIESFRYEDCVDIDDMVTLSIKDKSPSIVDDPDLQEGKKIIFSYGYLDRQSGRRLAQIENIEPDFSGTVNLTIKAFDLGLMLKKEERSDIWEGLKASDIVKRIAARNGLKFNVQESQTVHGSLPQGNRTDFDFLKYLSEIEADGSFRFFVKDDVINFNRLDLKRESQKTFRYGDQNGKIVSFRPRTGGTHKNAASANTKVVGVDPLTGETYTQKVDNKNASDDTKLGDYPIYYDANGVRQASPSEKKKDNPENAAGKNIVVPTASSEEARNVANKSKKKAAMDDITASLITEGDPFLTCDSIITISGVGQKFSGNWYITKVSHSISGGSSYSNSIELKKNASKTNVSSAEKATDQNATKGPDESKKEKSVKVYTYNSRGEEAKKS